jgi:3-hydroxyacyl-CoA dehydrogenase
MGQLVTYDTREGVTVITLTHGPVNCLSQPVRAALAAALARAAADANSQAVVLAGAGRGFSAGADLAELGTPQAHASPGLPELQAALEAMPKPVVAALAGFALGGGLELALACHHRVAAPDARLGLPEVKLGLLPGAGGTQRLPRLIPLGAALEATLTGEPLTGEQALALGLVDARTEGEPVASAVAFARALGPGAARPRARDRAVRAEGEPAALAGAALERLGKRAKGNPALAAIAECVQAAARLPFEEGLALERARFDALAAGAESRALRHAFLAERRAARVPGLTSATPAREVERSAVIGAGTMGTGIAMALLDAGLPVVLVEIDPPQLERAQAAIRERYAASVAKGKLAQPEAEARLARLRPALRLEEASEADFVIEAIFERMEIKATVFRQLDWLARPGAILASNTSTLNLDALAAVTGRPERVVGTHFFSPAQVMRLLEVVRGQHTSPETLATTLRLGRRLAKATVVSGICDGFIGNRMVERYFQQALLLLEEGATPSQVDGALERWGMAMGIFTMYDLAGNDVGYDIRLRRAVERPELIYSPLADRLVKRGRDGQKVGRGWHDYPGGARRPSPSPEVEALVQSRRAELGLTPRAISDEEVVERCIYALVNEAGLLLEEGIALRASDVDLVYLTGYGFPSWRGGPLHYASSVGLARMASSVARFRAGHGGDQWPASPLLERLAQSGQDFDAYDLERG